MKNLLKQHIEKLHLELEIPAQFHYCHNDCMNIEFFYINQNLFPAKEEELNFNSEPEITITPNKVFFQLDKYNYETSYVDNEKENLISQDAIKQNIIKYLITHIKINIAQNFIKKLSETCSKNIDKSHYNLWDDVKDFMYKLFKKTYTKKYKIYTPREILTLIDKTFYNLYKHKFLVGKRFIIISPKIAKFIEGLSMYKREEYKYKYNDYTGIRLIGHLNDVNIYVNDIEADKNNIYFGVQPPDTYTGLYFVYSSKVELMNVINTDFNRTIKAQVYYKFVEIGDDAYLNYRKLNIKIKKLFIND